MVERTRVRWLPFSPWHLLLMPMALIMLVPLVWMVITSLETLDPDAPLPSAAVARHPAVLENYPEALRAAPFARWFW